jgi:hypothetical protein
MTSYMLVNCITHHNKGKYRIWGNNWKYHVENQPRSYVYFLMTNVISLLTFKLFLCIRGCYKKPVIYKNKYRICPIRIEIIHGGLNIYWFYHGLALYADILPFAIAQGKIFDIKGQPVVKSVYIQAPMNYFLNIQCHGLISVGYCSFPFFSSVGPYISSILSFK